MGIVGGWFMVALIAGLALFLALEVFKVMRGDVVLSARQKVVRLMGGAMMLGVLAMIALSAEATRGRTAAFDLMYWLAALALAVGVLLMGALDAAEVGRQFVKGSRGLRQGTLTEEDVHRLIESGSDEERPGQPPR